MEPASSDELTPDQVTGVEFATRFRGLDPTAVTAHLERVADLVRSLEAENASLRAESERLGAELHDADRGPVVADLDEEELSDLLGHEAARVLTEARSAASDRLAEAETEATEIRAAAESLHADRSRAADLEVGRIRAEARALVDQARTEAEEEGERIRAEATADADAIRDRSARDEQAAEAEGARIIREAELARRQILEDLARRRSSARRQIEQLRAGRERLLTSHEVVRRALDEIADELTISMSEARAAAETAGHTVSDTTIEELEAEIETARLSGLLDTGPVPVVEATPSSPLPATDESTSESGDSGSDQVGTEAEPADATTGAGEADDASTTGEAGQVDDTDTAEVAANVMAEVAAGDAPEEAADGALADVVPLDRARDDVDTATHPAAGREKARNGPSEPEPDALPDLDDTDDLDDLFARMRSNRDAQETARAEKASKPKAKRAPKANAPEATDTAEAPDDASSADVAAELDTLAVDLARRLKRVLADEQSAVMSTLRASKKTPSAAALLGPVKEHRARYWAEVEPAATAAYRLRSGGSGKPGREPRNQTDELVGGLRRRVEECLDSGGSDTDAIVDELRGVYREIKTQRLNDHAETVCRTAADLGAGRS